MFDYRARVVRFGDGDTIRLEFDQGLGGRQEESVRLVNTWMPEMSQPGGSECAGYVVEWFGRLQPLRWPLYVVTVPSATTEPTERRSFVRYLATVWDIANRTRNLNADLNAFLLAHPEWGHGERITRP